MRPRRPPPSVGLPLTALWDILVLPGEAAVGDAALRARSGARLGGAESSRKAWCAFGFATFYYRPRRVSKAKNITTRWLTSLSALSTARAQRQGRGRWWRRKVGTSLPLN